MITSLLRAQMWLANKTFDILFVLVLSAAVWSFLFCCGVRCWSLSGWDQPSLSSFDPMQRTAAARAAAKTYGGKP